VLQTTWLREASQDPALLRQAYDEVLRPSFLPNELPSWDFLLTGFAPPARQSVGILHEVMPGGARSVRAVGVTNWRSGRHVGTLSYLATAPAHRGEGLGGTLIEEHAQQWPTLGLSTVLGEVHDPRLHAETADERPLDRLRFYDRHGAGLVGVPWVQPSLSSQTERSRGMLLIVLPPVPGAIPAGDLTEWALDYYLEAEGTSATDGELAALMARFGERPSWSPGPVMAFAEVEPLHPAGRPRHATDVPTTRSPRRG
jgi:GNAT superfamily N-acetyltransferase